MHIRKFTGPGKEDILSNPSRILLYNFGIDESQLKPEHKAFLTSLVAPTLKNGGSVSIVGLASRSGSFRHNDRLSLCRAESVRTFLEHTVRNGFPIREFKSFGERKAKLDGVRNGVEDERYRSVLLFLSTSPKPPEPVLDDSVIHEIQLPNIGKSEGILDYIGQGIDVTTGGAAIINLVVDSVLLDVGGTLLGALGNVLAMPAVWLEANKFARNNGQKLGFSKALQEMADVYSDYDLRLTPESQWKALPHPVPKFGPLSDASVTVAERSARVGTREGYEAAWRFISQMDRSPRIISGNVNHKPVKFRVSGRAFLWWLRQRYQEDLWRKVHERF